MNGNLFVVESNASFALVGKCAKPTRGLVVPRAHEHSVLDDDHPHSRVAMLFTRSYAEDLGEVLEEEARKSAGGPHGF
jgi:hypothetical protein